MTKLVNEQLLRDLKAKFDEGPEAASIDDIPLLFKFSKELISENEELKEEYLDMEINACLNIPDANKKFWIKIKDADFEYGEGDIEGESSFTLTANLITMAKIVYGEEDPTSAYMAGDITIEGNLQDALSFNEFLEIGLEEFEDQIELLA